MYKYSYQYHKRNMSTNNNKSKGTKTQTKTKKIVKDVEEEVVYVLNVNGLQKNYGITKTGKIWNIKTKKFMLGRMCNGCRMIKINDKDYEIHYLVAQTFVPQPLDKSCINHIDDDKTNNNPENLEWISQPENTDTEEIEIPKQILQIDSKTGKVIQIFDEIADAASAADITNRVIQLVLNGKNKTAGGYRWKYVDVNDDHTEAENTDEISNGSNKSKNNKPKNSSNNKKTIKKVNTVSDIKKTTKNK